MVDNDACRVVENDHYWQFPQAADTEFIESIAGPYLHIYSEKFDYRYEPQMTHLAGTWCGAEVFRRLRLYDSVAVSNTFIKREHIFLYVEQCRKLGIRIKLHRPSTPWSGDADQCFLKNIHGVPAERLAQMKKDWEEITQAEIDILLGVPKE